MPEISKEVIRIAAVLGAFTAIAVSLYVYLRARVDRTTIRAGLEDALAVGSGGTGSRSAVMHAPFAQRVLGPATRSVAGLVYRFGPKGLAEQTRERLVLAGLGDRIDPDTFFAVSAALPVLFGGLVLTYTATGGSAPLLAWFFVPASAMFPKMWLTTKVEQRQHAMRMALPDTLDLLTIAVEAGLGFDAALTRVVSTIRGPLSDEFFRMLQEIKIGVPRGQAFKSLSERTDIMELDQFITAMNQADQFGISIGRVLRVQAAQLRLKRSQLAEERAAKTPVKLLFPLIFCIFPALFVVIVGPAALEISDKLFGNM